MDHILKATTKENRNVLNNFLYNERSNVECLFIPDYDIVLLQYLDGYINSFQKHTTFNKFLNSELKERYQFIDMQDVNHINENDSIKLFQRVRGNVKIIMYDSTKEFNQEIFKYCGWLRMYTWTSDKTK